MKAMKAMEVWWKLFHYFLSSNIRALPTNIETVHQQIKLMNVPKEFLWLFFFSHKISIKSWQIRPICLPRTLPPFQFGYDPPMNRSCGDQSDEWLYYELQPSTYTHTHTPTIGSSLCLSTLLRTQSMLTSQAPPAIAWKYLRVLWQRREPGDTVNRVTGYTWWIKWRKGIGTRIVIW